MSENVKNRHPRIWGENWPYQLQEAISGATSNEIRHMRARWKDRRVKKMIGIGISSILKAKMAENAKHRKNPNSGEKKVC
jgi:hypothetical protein